jgi:hypothetical protein
MDANRPAISTEGMIGFVLALIGLGGAGALFEFPHPYADVVGWLLIGIAVIGLIILAIYHARSRGWLKLRAQSIFGLSLIAAALSVGLWYAWSITPTPPKEIPGPPQPLLSSAAKFIFACDLPSDPHATPEQLAERKESLRKAVEAWGDAIGFAIEMSDIRGGIRITIEAKTLDAKNKLISLGIVPAVTKINFELRRVDEQIIVTTYGDVPGGWEFLSIFTPDRNTPQILTAQKQIAAFIGARKGGCRLM